jgi:chemotaxis protein CheD
MSATAGLFFYQPCGKFASGDRLPGNGAAFDFQETMIKIDYKQTQRVIIEPGEFYVGRQPEIISTLLGSCVAACLYDPVMRIIGMNHFLLAYRNLVHKGSLFESEAGRYGLYAMELLINGMLRQGANKLNLKAKVFGGGNVLKLREARRIGHTVGDVNCLFIKEFLRKERIPVISSSLGGNIGRNIHFVGSDFSVYVKPIYHADNLELERIERRYWLKTIQQQATEKPVVEFW